jgi:RND family efflux transporter MFP subunit
MTTLKHSLRSARPLWLNLRAGVLLILLMPIAGRAVAAPVRGAADGLSVSITSDPPVIALGKSTLHLEIAEAGKPVLADQVRVFVHMPGMDMGEREEIAQPITERPGTFTAPATFAMAGTYVAEIVVRRNANERRVSVRLATGMDTSPGTATGWKVYAIGTAALLAFIVFTGIRMRRTGQRINLRPILSLRTLGALALLAASLGASFYAVRHWRRPGSMTPIEAQAMEMATPAPPGVAPVRTEAVSRGSVEDAVTYVGRASGWVEQDIYPRTTGWIVTMPVYVGSRVRAGDLLARLDTTSQAPAVAERAAGFRMSAQAEITAASGVRQARAALTRAQSDVRAKTAELESAVADVTAAEAELAGAQEALAGAQAMVTEARAATDAATAERSYRDAELRRAQTLKERGAVSVQELDRAIADAASASAAVQQATSRAAQAEASVRSAAARVRGLTASLEAARRRATSTGAMLDALRSSVEESRAALDAALSRTREARAQKDQSRAMLGAAQISARYAEVRATADGVVTERLLPPGVLANPGQPILRIVQTRPIRLQAAVSEADLPAIHVGASVEAWRVSDPSARVHTRVSSIAALVDPASRTATVEAVWPNTGPVFQAGEAITLRIRRRVRHDVLRVPTVAVQEVTGGGSSIEGRTVTPYVWVARREGSELVARRVPFQAGIRGDRYWEVRSGVLPDDRVIVEGMGALRDGDPVTEAPSGAAPSHAGHAEAAYTCPMHPEVTSARPGRCPKCGMALVQTGKAR